MAAFSQSLNQVYKFHEKVTKVDKFTPHLWCFLESIVIDTLILSTIKKSCCRVM